MSDNAALAPFAARITAAHKRRFRTVPSEVHILLLEEEALPGPYFEAITIDRAQNTLTRWEAHRTRILHAHTGAIPATLDCVDVAKAVEACRELIYGSDKPGDHLQRVIDLAREAFGLPVG